MRASPLLLDGCWPQGWPLPQSARSVVEEIKVTNLAWRVLYKSRRNRRGCVCLIQHQMRSILRECELSWTERPGPSSTRLKVCEIDLVGAFKRKAKCFVWPLKILEADWYNAKNLELFGSMRTKLGLSMSLLRNDLPSFTSLPAMDVENRVLISPDADTILHIHRR